MVEKFVFRVVPSFNEAKEVVNQLTINGVPSTAIQIVANQQVAETLQNANSMTSVEILDEEEMHEKEQVSHQNNADSSLESGGVIPTPAITHEGLNATDGIVPMVINQGDIQKSNLEDGIVDAYQADIDNGNILVVVDTEYEAEALSTQ